MNDDPFVLGAGHSQLKISPKMAGLVCMYIVNELDFPSYFDLSSGTTLKIIIYFMDLNPGLGTVFLVV